MFAHPVITPIITKIPSFFGQFLAPIEKARGGGKVIIYGGGGGKWENKDWNSFLPPPPLQTEGKLILPLPS